MIDLLKGEINFLKSAWQNLLGRPLLTLVLKTVHLGRCCEPREQECPWFSLVPSKIVAKFVFFCFHRFTPSMFLCSTNLSFLKDKVIKQHRFQNFESSI